MTSCDTTLEHTLFLGCSIESFSCNLGFNEQPTEVNVRIVRDICPAVDDHPKIYYDIYDNDPRKEWTAADPGFSSFGINQNETPNLGAPVYFRVGTFEFCGILQSWTKVNTRSDVDIYDVKLISPVEILQGSQVILGDYSGPVKGFNIFNVYGFLEVFSANFPAGSFSENYDGIVQGAYAGGFGGSGITKVGMTWNKIKQGINILTSSLSPVTVLNSLYTQYSEFGRIAYHGGQINARFGLLVRDELNSNVGLLSVGVSSEICYYTLDISGIPNVPDDYRIAGPSISILALISQVCNDFGFDFYIELLPVRVGGIVHKIIKVRTISRAVQPDLGVVQSFIDSTSEVIDSSFGRELVNESTSTFLVGGQKQNVWQVQNGCPENDPEGVWLNQHFGSNPYVYDNIVPYFGLDQNKNPYICHFVENDISAFYRLSNLYCFWPSDTSYINFDLLTIAGVPLLNSLVSDTTLRAGLGKSPGNDIKVTIFEMRAAAHGFDNWTWFSNNHLSDLRLLLDAIDHDIDSLQARADHIRDTDPAFAQFLDDWLVSGLDLDLFCHKFRNHWLPRDIVKLKKVKQKYDFFEGKVSDLDRFRNRMGDELRVYVETIAGIYNTARHTFMVRAPWISSRFTADLTVSSTDEPIEGGWTESPLVLGLDNPGPYLDKMRLEDGLVRPFCTSTFPLADNRFYQTYDSIRALADEVNGFYFDSNEIGRSWYIGIHQENELIYLDRLTLKSPRVIITLPVDLDLTDKQKDDNFNFINAPHKDGEIIKSDLAPVIYEPDHVAVTLKNTVFTYGPWKANNIIQAGPPGQIKFQKEDDLVPWTFGSITNLNSVAQTRVNNCLTTTSQSELGNVSVYGIPTIPLGAEIGSLKGLTEKFYPFNEHLLENRPFSFTTASLTNSNGDIATFTIPSVPYDYWNGSFGPNITSIAVDLSASQVQTTYVFRTTTPKFGVLGQLNASRIEQRLHLENQRRAQSRFYQENKRIQQGYNKKFNKLSHSLARTQRDVLRQLGTPHAVFVGSVHPWSSTVNTTMANTGDGAFRRPIINTKSLFELKNDLIEGGTGIGIIGTDNTGPNIYDTTAVMSLDGLIRPVSMSGIGALPSYVQNDSEPKGNTVLSIPPFKNGVTGTTGVYNYNLSLQYFNPFSNPTGYNYAALSAKHVGTAGHDIDIVARRTLDDFTASGKSLTMSNDIDGYTNAGGRADYANDYRFFAMRGPIVMQSWGYDTDGKPIPNENDNINNIVNSGIFKTTGLGDKFLPDFLRKSQAWPVAPIDLRYDRHRNVWTAPPAYDYIIATLSTGINPFGSGLAKFSISGAYDAIGRQITSGNIIVYDQLGSAYGTGAKVIAYYDIKNSKYNIIGGAGSGSGPIGASSGVSSDIRIVLIENDIDPAITEDNPFHILSGTSIPSGTGITIIFQDPPSDDLSANVVNSFNLWSYERKKVSLKYYFAPTKTVITSGIVQAVTSNSITLQNTASNIDGFYLSNTVIINNTGTSIKQTGICNAYSGSIYKLYATPSWSPSFPTGSIYEISNMDLGYEEIAGVAKSKLILKTTITDIPGDGTTNRVVRYDFTDIFYDDRKPLKCGEYDLNDYPDYPENNPWPPPDLPDGFLKRRKRGIIINNVLVRELCFDLPPPLLTGTT